MLKKDIVESFNDQELIRLNKFLSDSGVCSRREADKLIESGKVIVDGKVASVGTKVYPTQNILCEGRPVTREEELIFLAFNKPVGIECTTNKEVKENIIDYLNYPKRIYPVGRLDKNSEGLILLTNNGDIVNRILKAVNYHEKEYIVTVNKEVTDEFIKKMSQGVPILDTITRKCTVKKVNENTFSIILTQGLNRQIRRMCETLGYKVVKLKRIRIMNIHLGKLKSGTYRKITKEEIENLKNSFK